MTPITSVHKAAPERTVLRVAARTTAAALGTNLSVFAIARAADVSFPSPQPGSAGGTETVSTGAVLVVTLFTMTVGLIVVGVAAWRHRPALRTLGILGGVIAAVSALAPLTVEADMPARLILTGVHLVVGAFFLIGILQLGRAATRVIR